MGGQQVDHLGRILQRGRVDGQVREGGVPTHHVGRRLVYQVQDVDQHGAVQWFGQVLDDVELDVTLLEDLKGASGFPSAGVVDQQETTGIHGSHAPDGTVPVTPP